MFEDAGRIGCGVVGPLVAVDAGRCRAHLVWRAPGPLGLRLSSGGLRPGCGPMLLSGFRPNLAAQTLA